MRLLISFALLLIAFNVNAVTVFTGGNFTMLDNTGNVFGGTNDVNWTFDETVINSTVDGTAFNGDIYSNQPFFGFQWDAHEVRVFGEGTYTFDTTCTAGQIQSGISNCNNPLGTGQTEQYITIEVGSGQLGLHMLWDWGSPTSTERTDFDIAIVWNQNSLWVDPDGSSSPVNSLWLGPAGDAPDPSLAWQLVSTDANADGFNGVPFVDGPLNSYYPNFNFGQVPIPAAVWLFSSGLIGLISVARRNKESF
jgi:hypothetical protein